MADHEKAFGGLIHMSVRPTHVEMVGRQVVTAFVAVDAMALTEWRIVEGFNPTAGTAASVNVIGGWRVP